MTGTVWAAIGALTSLLVIAGFVWYKLSTGAAAQSELDTTKVQMQVDAERQKATDAALAEKMAEQREDAEKLNEANQKIADDAARRAAILAQLDSLRGVH